MRKYMIAALFMGSMVVGIADRLFAIEDVTDEIARAAWEKQKLKRKAGSGQQTKGPTKESDKEVVYRGLKLASEIVSMVEEKAFRAVNFSDFFQDALKAAIARVDAHSSFFTRDSYQAALDATRGSFEGIGVSIIAKAPEDEALVLTDVLEGGPAKRARRISGEAPEPGLRPGDRIVEVNGEKLRGLSSDEAISKIKGPRGTKVRLKIIRRRKPLEFEVMRDRIKDQSSLCYYFKDFGIYYLALKMFTETAAKQMTELLQKANNQTCRGIILDLRNNPGGVLESAVDMAGLFLNKGSLVVTTKNNKNKQVAQYKTHSDPVLTSDVPIFVIVNNFTASASEILAGCLQHYSDVLGGTGKKHQRNLMVFVVGSPTFGKGSVQEVMPVSEGCALKLTTMLYFIPGKKGHTSIQATGVIPDFVVKPRKIPASELKWVDELYGKETSLKYHISAQEVAKVTGDPAPPKVETEKDLLIDEEDEDFDENGGVRIPGQKAVKTEEELEKRRQQELSHNVQIQVCVNMINLLSFAKQQAPDLVANRPKALSFLKSHYLCDNITAIERLKGQKDHD